MGGRVGGWWVAAHLFELAKRVQEQLQVSGMEAQRCVGELDEKFDGILPSSIPPIPDPLGAAKNTPTCSGGQIRVSAGLGKAWLGLARLGRARQGSAGLGKARLGSAWLVSPDTYTATPY